MRSGGAANNYTSGVVASLIELGLAKKHLDMCRNKYRVSEAKRISNIHYNFMCICRFYFKERMEIACKILRENLPKDCVFLEPKGGFFIWLKFPANVVAADFNLYCLDKYQVVAIAGDTFSASGLFKNCLRITIGFHGKENLALGLEKLCKAYGEFVALTASG